MTSSVVGTVRKYQNAFAIKKHNAQVRAWAAPMALDIAVAFWDTWKSIEKKLPDGDDFPKTSSEKREAKNKYEAIIELEISRQSPLLTNIIQSYTQKVWIAGAVEQCRRLGCLSWFLSSLTRLPYQRESQTPPTANLVEAESWVNLPNLLAQRYSDERAAEVVTQINETTRKELSSIISKGVESGTSYGDIAKEIQTKFEQFAVPKPQQHIPNRAVLVAVTELGNAYCQATLDLADSLQSSGVRMMKAWQTLEDGRVSDGCRHNQDAGWIELDDTFPSGASRPPRFPGCRCDILTDMLDESMLGRSLDDYFDRPDEFIPELPDEVLSQKDVKFYENIESAERGFSKKYESERSEFAKSVMDDVFNNMREYPDAWGIRAGGDHEREYIPDLREYLRIAAGRYYEETGMYLSGFRDSDKLKEILDAGCIGRTEAGRILLLSEYCGSSKYSRVNRQLRNVELTPSQKRSALKDWEIELIRDAFNNSDIDVGINVNRYMSSIPKQIEDALHPGGTFSDGGICSTTLSDTHIFEEEARLVMHISVPPGKNRGLYAQSLEKLYPNNYGHYLEGEQKEDALIENEFMLTPGTRFRVIRVEEKDGIKEAWVEVYDE